MTHQLPGKPAASTPVPDPPVPKLRLNLGSGGAWMGPGIINIDSRNLLPPEGITFLRADISDLRNYFEDGCASEIWAHGVLEIFRADEVGSILREWARLLALGGVLHLRTKTSVPRVIALLVEVGLRLIASEISGERVSLQVVKAGSGGNGHGSK